MKDEHSLTFFFICRSHLDTDPDPAVQNQCGSGSTTLQLALDMTFAKDYFVTNAN
jgi:hypothetical protein